ncbi:MAG: ABC transporter permease [Chloroflexi bacterium]|nr:ABC transporter permease [Chloroflexota bacterium]
MLRLAFRNLFQNKTRFVISIGGVALALLLILVLDAVLTGVQTQVTAYILNSNADIIVSQENVRNLHMAYSALPAAYETQVRNVAGVASVTPIHYLTNLIEVGETRNLAYVIGLPREVDAGGPWRIIAGNSLPGDGETIIDRGVAVNSGVGLGDTVKILGEEFKIAGLSDGTSTISGGSVAFITQKDFVETRKDVGSVSFFFVRIAPGESAEQVAARIEQRVDKVTAQTRAQFAERERQVVNDMSTDIVTIMNLVGFLIGVAVMALTVYTATLARRAEYGVLKAVGARNAHLYRVVLAQAFISVVFGFGVGLGITLLLVVLVPRLDLPLALEVSAASLVKVASVSLVFATVSALLPIKQIAGLDPARVFRGK